MNTTQLKEFFTSRPSLSKRGVCREAGISDTLLDRIMFRGGTLTDNVATKLTPVLNRYGGKFLKIGDSVNYCNGLFFDIDSINHDADICYDKKGMWYALINCKAV